MGFIFNQLALKYVTPKSANISPIWSDGHGHMIDFSGSQAWFLQAHVFSFLAQATLEIIKNSLQ